MNPETLTREGGDRFAGRRDMVEVIRGALAESLTDAEIRKHFRLWDDEIVTPEKRERMARQKARQTYDAMMVAFCIAAGEPLKHADGRPGGLNFGGIMRIGQIMRVGLEIVATDDDGIELADRGIEIYQMQVRGDGFVLYPAYANLPGFWPWGSPDVIEDGGLYFVEINGEREPLEFVKDGTKGPDDVYRAWFYDEPGEGVKRVRWRSVEDGTAQVPKLKAKVIEKFWTELNGLAL